MSRNVPLLIGTRSALRFLDSGASGLCVRKAQLGSME